MDDALQGLIDEAAIARLQRAYADGVTRRDWDQVRDLFLPDATVEIELITRPGRTLAGPDEIVGFVAAALDRFDFFQFVVLNHLIDLWPGDDRSVATARIFMCELRVPLGTTGRDDAHGRYEDTYRKVDGTWRIAARRYRSMARFPEGTSFPLD